MDYQLIDVTPNDILDIYLIKKHSNKTYIDIIWGWDEAYQRKDFESSFDVDNFKLIKSKHQTIGFVELLETDDVINITELHIKPDFQGCGIGSDIIKTTLGKAKHQAKTVTTGCFKINECALKLYKILGFEISDETDTHFMLEYPIRNNL